MTPFENILGQTPAVETLRRALETGRIHHAYRFEGPEGVGKEKTALELAACLVCPHHPTYACSDCMRRATTLSSEPPCVPLHPDVVLVGRGIYTGRIEAPETTGISVEQVRRVVLGRAGFSPHEGARLVFIIRDADQLTLQAANALLKTLEEPGPAVHFVLLTTRPQRLPDTVLSRTLPVRFGPLPDQALEQILARRGLSLPRLEAAQGSAALALELVDEQALRAREQFVTSVAEAIRAPDLVPALDLSEKRPADRAELGRQLGYLALDCAARARHELSGNPDQAERMARAHRIVLEALRELERNVQPALVLESMILRLRRA